MRSLPLKPLILMLTLILFSLSVLTVGKGPASISSLQGLQIVANMLGEALNLPSLSGWLAHLISAEQVEAWQRTVIEQVRLPRVITAALVGASLAMSGAVLQGLFRNPLASPSVLGVSSGASLGAVLAIFFGLAASTVWALPLFAFIGAAATLFVVYRIACVRGQAPIGTLLLSGVAVSAFNIAMSSLVLALALQNWELGKSIVYWTMGGLDGRNWYHVMLLLPVFGLCAAVMFSHQRELDILLVGEIHANALGVDVAKVRLYLLLATTLLTGCAVAVAGGIGFIGLVVPHITRLLIGPHHQRLLPVSAFLGAIILLLADLLVRGDASYAAISLGVVTAAMGAPFFLFLLMKQRKLMQV